jgi:hypothetical protein
MIISEDVKKVLSGSSFLTLVTLGADASAHPIVLGHGEIADDTISFGIYKMEQTQKNLANNKKAWITCATLTDGKPLGYRISGTAEAKDKTLLFTAAKAEALM